VKSGEVIPIEAPELWHQLAGFELFASFTEEESLSFRWAFEREALMCVRGFASGEFVCHKGEYQLDLCFILRGTVDLYDHTADGSAFKVASLSEGDFFGELGAIRGQPRTTDVVAAADDTRLLYIPRHCLTALMSNLVARRAVTERYQERAIRVLAQGLELFKGVAQEFIEHLIGWCEIVRYDTRGVPLIQQGEEADALYIVSDGAVQVVVDRPDGSHRILEYLREGEFFGEMALLGGGVRTANVLTAGKCELVKLNGSAFMELCQRYPEVEKHVRGVIEARHRQEKLITPEISDLLEKSGQLGYVQAAALLVMDLDLCVKCDNCVKACESLHGESRLVRSGVTIGKYLVPVVCRHCEDPRCMNSCPTGAVERRPEGEIYFEYDKCIGCGNCAIACPYDSIAMIETGKFDRAQANKAAAVGRPFYRPYPVASHCAAPGIWERISAGHARGERERLAGGEFLQIRDRNDTVGAPAQAQVAPGSEVPVAFPIKCDLCDGLPIMGCVHNCPTGAAIRVSSATLFGQTHSIRGGSAPLRKAG
jgi:CRP-like cAMP-binding protein/Fe-S-cluster-containing hydrogenase component 2